MKKLILMLLLVLTACNLQLSSLSTPTPTQIPRKSALLTIVNRSESDVTVGISYSTMTEETTVWIPKGETRVYKLSMGYYSKTVYCVGEIQTESLELNGNITIDVECPLPLGKKPGIQA